MIGLKPSIREYAYQQSNSYYWDPTDAPWAPPGYQLLAYAPESWTYADGRQVPIVSAIAEMFQDYTIVSDSTWLCLWQTANDNDLYEYVIAHYQATFPYAPSWEKAPRPGVDVYQWQTVNDWIKDRITLGLMVMAVWGPASICNGQNPDGSLNYRYSLRAVDVPTFWSLQGAPFNYIVAVPSHNFPSGMSNRRDPVQSTFRQWLSSQIDGTDTLLINWIPPGTQIAPPDDAAPPPPPASPPPAEPPSGEPPSRPSGSLPMPGSPSHQPAPEPPAPAPAPTGETPAASNTGAIIFGGTVLVGSLLGALYLISRPPS